MKIETILTPEIIGLSKQEQDTLKVEVDQRKKEIDDILNTEFKVLNRHNFKQCVDKVLGKVDMLDSFVAENETEVLNLTDIKNKSYDEIKSHTNDPKIAPLLRPFKFSEEINKKFYKGMTWRATEINAYYNIIKAAINVVESERGIEIERIHIEALTKAFTDAMKSKDDQIANLNDMVKFLVTGKDGSSKQKPKKDSEKEEIKYDEE